MTNLETVASPAVVTTIILSACVLGIGFMIRFFVALALEEKNTRPAYALRPRGVHSRARHCLRSGSVSHAGRQSRGLRCDGSCQNYYGPRLQCRAQDRLIGFMWSGSTSQAQKSISQDNVVIARAKAE